MSDTVSSTGTPVDLWDSPFGFPEPEPSYRTITVTLPTEGEPLVVKVAGTFQPNGSSSVEISTNRPLSSEQEWSAAVAIITNFS